MFNAEHPHDMCETGLRGTRARTISKGKPSTVKVIRLSKNRVSPFLPIVYHKFPHIKMVVNGDTQRHTRWKYMEASAIVDPGNNGKTNMLCTCAVAGKSYQTLLTMIEILW